MFNFVLDQMEYNSPALAVPDRWRQMIENQSIPLKDNEIYMLLVNLSQDHLG